MSMLLALVGCGAEAQAPPPPVAEETATPEPQPTATTAPQPEPTEEVVVMEESVTEAFEPMSVAAENCDYGGKILSIESSDEMTVVFTLCQPDSAFLTKIAFTAFSIQPAEWITENEGGKKLLTHPIGTGPYKIEKWNFGDSIVYKRFDDYWGEAAIAETAILRWSDESVARLLELEAGTADYITHVNPDDFEAINNNPDLQLVPYPAPNTFYIGLNNRFEPFDDVRVRQAIAMGIDRQKIVAGFYPEGSTVPDFFTPCTVPNGCEGEAWYDFDLEAARELLAEAGYGDGFETTLYFRDVFRTYLPQPVAVAAEIQAQLKENLNIKVEVVLMESSELIKQVNDSELSMFLLGWNVDYPHMSNTVGFAFSEQGRRFGDPHPEIYEPMQKASAMSGEEATPLYAQANNAIRELVTMVPVANGIAADAARADLGGVQQRPFGHDRLGLFDPAEGDTVVFLQSGEPHHLYCADTTDGETSMACSQPVEPLFNYALDSGEVVPALATSCDANEEGTVWTCHLRENVLFHDGSMLDANDVVVSWSVGIDASHPYHTGDSGDFDYHAKLWGGFMNAPEQ